MGAPPPTDFMSAAEVLQRPLARPVELRANSRSHLTVLVLNPAKQAQSEQSCSCAMCVIPPLDQRFHAARRMTRSHADAEDLLRLDCLQR
ncbi:MAG: hypothetical protein QOC63_3582 [Mycobacterium sp.]|nr:hypothetical protein [Mycobacterium sp.]